MNASEAREKLYMLLDESASDHEPVLITGPRSNAVLIAEEDWNFGRLSLPSKPRQAPAVSAPPAFGPKAELLNILAEDLRKPSPFEKLLGELCGAISKEVKRRPPKAVRRAA